MRLGDVCTKIGSGATPKGGKEAYKPSGIPLIRSQNVLDWSFTSNGLAFVDEGQAAALANVEVEPRDILLNITGDSVARACMVPDWCTPARVNQHVSIVRPGPDLDPTFLLCYLQSSKPLLLKLASSGATRNALTKGMIGDLEIELPNIETQRAIASLIGQIQQKIVLNQQTNDYLATLVDLEFSKRFSGSVSTTSLKNVLEISTKSLKPQQHAGETWEHYSIPAFDEMHWPIFELADGIKSNKYIVDRSSILISKLNPSIKRMWIPACLTDKAVCSTEFIVYKPLEPRHKSFYCAAINAASFTAFLLEHVTGSTGSRQRAQPKATLDYPMPSPCRTAIEAFCDFADPIYRQIELNGIESQRLGSLRDALLPKLMSGEIDVSKVGLMQPNNHLDDC